MWDRFKGYGAREVLHCIVLRFLGTSVLQGKFTLNMHGRALTQGLVQEKLILPAAACFRPNCRVSHTAALLCIWYSGQGRLNLQPPSQTVESLVLAQTAQLCIWFI